MRLKLTPMAAMYEMGSDLAVSQCRRDNKSKWDSRTSRNMGLKMDFKTQDSKLIEYVGFYVFWLNILHVIT